MVLSLRSALHATATGYMRLLPLLLLIMFSTTVWAESDTFSEDQLADFILVEKSKRRMKLYNNDKVIRVYSISLGKKPVGAKRERGDNKTPEGHYVINDRLADSAYHLALQISYPDELDTERANQKGIDPGDRIMIHGLPEDFGIRKRKRDWTNGCIAVTNREIEEIWHLVPDGTPIEIRP